VTFTVRSEKRHFPPHGIDPGRQTSLRQDYQVIEVPVRKLALSAALTLLCGGCAVAPPPEPVAAVPAAPPDCRNIATTATIDGKPQEVKGVACRAADGSWQFASPFEQPLYLLPPYQYAYYDPLWGWW
jgi:hypothetical protein